MDQPTTTQTALMDTHAHLDFTDYDLDRDAVMERAAEAGLVAIVTIGIETADWPSTLEIAAKYPSVHAALGIHPNSADQTNEQTLGDLAVVCRRQTENRVVALGET